jgi:hypothetical protein
METQDIKNIGLAYLQVLEAMKKKKMDPVDADVKQIVTMTSTMMVMLTNLTNIFTIVVKLFQRLLKKMLLSLTRKQNLMKLKLCLKALLI